MRGSTGRIALLLAALVLVAACTAGSPPPRPAASQAVPGGAAGDPPAAAPPPREPVRVGYAAIAGSFATPWMAKEAGLFEKYGLDADLTYIASGPTMLQAMVAGELDFGEVAAPSPMAAHLEGGEIVWIAAAVNRPVFFVVTPPELTRLEDLRGRALGVTRIGTTSHTFTKLAVRAAGLDPERDVTIL